MKIIIISVTAQFIHLNYYPLIFILPYLYSLAFCLLYRKSTCTSEGTSKVDAGSMFHILELSFLTFFFSLTLLVIVCV